MKVLWAARRQPEMDPAEFYRRWHAHGMLGLRVPQMHRLVQHHTLDEARTGTPCPTHDGASIGWFANLAAVRRGAETPEWDRGRQDGETLFDRSGPPCVVYANERVIVEGETEPDMVKLIAVVARREGLSLSDFQAGWLGIIGAIGSELPGLMRYVQNHGVSDAYDADGQRSGMSHDGWSELWFRDLFELHEAFESERGQELRDAAREIMDGHQTAIVIARELNFSRTSGAS